MKESKMKKEEPGYTSFIGSLHRLVIHFNIAGVIIFNSKQIKEVKNPDGNTLEPIYPDYCGERTRMVFVIPDTVNVPGQKKKYGRMI